MATHVDASVSLENGDHLTRDEFHRRYCLRPDIKKAELINGVVYVPSPVRVDRHGQPHFIVVAWLGMYVGMTPGVRPGADNATVLLEEGEHEVQPDAFLWRPEPNGPRVNERGYMEGAPQLIVEVAASSAAYDLHEKKEAYRSNGVAEYVVWRVNDTAVDWFRLIDGQYVTVAPNADGVVESEQFPGLRLHVRSLLAGDLPSLLAHMRPESGA
jgi:Uma2 family endonuclease